MFLARVRQVSVATALLLVVSFCLCAQSFAEVSLVRSAMYSQQPFVKQQSKFSLYDTFYCVFDVAGLEAGRHTMRVDWITPGRVLEQQSVYDFFQDKPGVEHRLYSWLKVWEKGPVSRILTGREFKNSFHGLWSVRIFIDEKLIGRQEFEAL